MAPAPLADQLTRTVALMTALRNKPQLPQLPPACEPANKKVTPQRQFVSAKKLSRKRKVAESMSEPNASEKTFLLSALDGTVAVVSSTADGTDHDYATAPGKACRI